MLSGEIDLLQFCEPEHEKLAKPWSMGEWSYASDGHMVVRVPRRKDVPEDLRAYEDGGPPTNGVLSLPWDHAELFGWEDLPVFDLTKAPPCTLCKGGGTCTVCRECDGEGEVLLENPFHEYEVTCKSCKGDGVMAGSWDEPRCPRCHGTGKNLNVGIPWGAGWIGMGKLVKIKDLPAVKLNRHGDGKVPWRFIFIGGCGLVMPMLGA